MAEQDRDLKTQGQEDTLKGKMKSAAGKVKEKVGEATGSHKMEAEGNVDQVKGKTRSKVGNVKRNVGKAVEPQPDYRADAE